MGLLDRPEDPGVGTALTKYEMLKSELRKLGEFLIAEVPEEFHAEEQIRHVDRAINVIERLKAQVVKLVADRAAQHEYIEHLEGINDALSREQHTQGEFDE